jgi:multisubunit Na+/H+ antiporter MnhE subunit
MVARTTKLLRLHLALHVVWFFLSEEAELRELLLFLIRAFVVGSALRGAGIFTCLIGSPVYLIIIVSVVVGIAIMFGIGCVANLHTWLLELALGR